MKPHTGRTKGPLSFSLVVFFSHADILSPYSKAVPAIIAKASAIYNPFIYAIIHNKYRWICVTFWVWPSLFIFRGNYVIVSFKAKLNFCLFVPDHVLPGWLWRQSSPAWGFCLPLLERTPPPPSASPLTGTPSSADSPQHQGLTLLRRALTR